MSRPDTSRNLPSPASPFVQVDGNTGTGILLLCDHAENRIPAEYSDLGLPAAELRRHIAWDPGAAAVTHALAARLGAPAVLSTFSRLLIDPNRGEDDPTLIMRLSDGSPVPGNASVDAEERHRRIRRFYAPYHAAIDAAIQRSLAAIVAPIVISIHSFTPLWRGALRPWHAGILWDDDPRVPIPLIAALRADAALVVGDNEPYSGGLTNDTLNRHGTRPGLAHGLIEIRQDLIGDEAGVDAWADRLSPILEKISRDPAVHIPRDSAPRAKDPGNQPLF